MYFRRKENGNMRKILFFLIAVTGLISCKKKPEFVLQAELQDYPSDEILVVYDDPVSKLDTIVPKNGKFIYTFAPDTLTLFRLISPDNGQTIPVVADKSLHMNLTGTFDNPVISGDGENGEYGKFLESIQDIKDDRTAVSQKAEEFITLHPQSFISAYLINDYFVQVPQPDIEKIRSLIDPLGGSVKDSRVLGVVLKSMPTKDKNERDEKYLAYFSCKDRNGKYITWSSSTENSYTLLNFWASWDKTSMAIRDSLTGMVKKLPEDKFRVLNISLDYEKKKWLDACKEDSKQWIEVCDYKGWGNQVVKQNNIDKLPTNILIDRNRKVIDKDLYGEALYTKVKQLTQEEKK